MLAADVNEIDVVHDIHDAHVYLTVSVCWGKKVMKSEEWRVKDEEMKGETA